MLHASWEHEKRTGSQQSPCPTRYSVNTGARPSVLDGTRIGASIAVIHVAVIARLASTTINSPVAAHGRGTDNARQQQEQHHECASPRHPRCPPRRLLTTNRPHHFAPGPCVSGNVGEGAAPSSVSVPPIPASSTTLLLGLTRMASPRRLCGIRWPCPSTCSQRTNVKNLSTCDSHNSTSCREDSSTRGSDGKTNAPACLAWESRSRSLGAARCHSESLPHQLLTADRIG